MGFQCTMCAWQRAGTVLSPLYRLSHTLIPSCLQCLWELAGHCPDPSRALNVLLEAKQLFIVFQLNLLPDEVHWSLKKSMVPGSTSFVPRLKWSLWSRGLASAVITEMGFHLPPWLMFIWLYLSWSAIGSQCYLSLWCSISFTWSHTQ